jgi:hypothetical protein
MASDCVLIKESLPAADRCHEGVNCRLLFTTIIVAFIAIATHGS